MTKLSSLLLYRCTLPEWFIWFAIACIFLSSLVLFVIYVNPSLNGSSPLRIGADSAYYLWRAGLRAEVPDSYSSSEASTLISLNGSVLGPEMLAGLLRNNYIILGFNCVLLLVTVRAIGRAVPLNYPIFGLLLLANPSILISVLTVNKEIFILLSAGLLFLIASGVKRSRFLLLLTLAVAFLGRWQHCLIILFFLLLRRSSAGREKWRKWQIVALILSITVLYPFIAAYVSLLLGAGSLESTTNALLTTAQEHFLFFVVVLPKIALNLFGEGLLFLTHGIKNDSPYDVYGSLIAPLSSLANLAVTSWFLLSRRLDMMNDRLFFAVLYAVLFSITPFVQCRYFLPVYLVLSIEISRPRRRKFGTLTSHEAIA